MHLLTTLIPTYLQIIKHKYTNYLVISYHNAFQFMRL